jgi:sirohydrochlorin ferrochelatase
VRRGIIVFAHGSSVESANDAVRAVASDAARRGGWELFETAFLEVSPRLGQAVVSLMGRGAEELLVVPYFLTLGIHLQRDLPKLVSEISREHDIAIQVVAPLDGHPELSRILADRVMEALGVER